jgi:uncharacterized protein (DUF111 family)
MLLMVNVDNVTGDTLPYVIDRIFDRGAKNVNACTAITKKGRLGYLFFIDAEPEFADPIMEFLARELGTLGVRVLASEHRKFAYRFQKVRLSLPAEGGSPLELEVCVKLVLDEQNGGPISARAEYRDLEAALRALDQAGRKVTMSELRAMAELAVLQDHHAAGDRIRVEVLPEDPPPEG